MNTFVNIIIILLFADLIYSVVSDWKKMCSHWKTTLRGAAALIVLLAVVIQFYFTSGHHFLFGNQSYLFAILFAICIGLLLCADGGEK